MGIWSRNKGASTPVRPKVWLTLRMVELGSDNDGFLYDEMDRKEIDRLGIGLEIFFARGGCEASTRSS